RGDAAVRHGPRWSRRPRSAPPAPGRAGAVHPRRGDRSRPVLSEGLSTPHVAVLAVGGQANLSSRAAGARIDEAEAEDAATELDPCWPTFIRARREADRLRDDGTVQRSLLPRFDLNGGMPVEKRGDYGDAHIARLARSSKRRRRFFACAGRA